VEAWDNQGDPVTKTYGPVCYDTVSPTISASTKPATSGTVWVNQPVVVTLTATDPGGSKASGIYRTYYAINTNSCDATNLSACNVYGGPFTISGQQQTFIYYFTVDHAGNPSAETYIWVSIDTTPPTTTASLSGTLSSGSIYTSNVQVTLNATDSGGSGVEYTYFQRNGGPTTAYTGPFTASGLGSHSIKYWSVDSAGNVESAHTIAFSIESATTAKMAASPNPSVFGQAVTMTATVKATVSGPPTGSVTFWNGATNLGTATLSGGTATLTTTSLPAGALTLQASYLGNSDYLASNSAPFDETVDKAASVITWPTPAPITYGTKIGPTQQDATANVPGTFVYAQPSGWEPKAGTHTMTVTFTPTDTTDYKTATATVTLTVNQAKPVITWPTPAPITVGTAVGPTQQDATANVPGTFVYAQPAGWKPIVGTHTMTVTFTPTDTSDYKTATASVVLTVNPST
jgi:hypothetical protein